ncbi:MAG: efflux RND transporter periplasmic adaptor subunit [Chloroflexota bacterium]
MRGGKVIFLAVILLILIGVGFFLNYPETGQQLLVELELATPVPKSYISSGILEAEVVHLGSEQGGRVMAFFVEEGEEVQKGEVIAQLDTSLLEVQRQAAQARYAAAMAQWELLGAGASPEDVAVAQAEVNLARIVLASALQALEDARALDDADPRREVQITIAQAQVDQAQADVEVAQSWLQALEDVPTESDLVVAQAAVDAALADLEKIEGQIAAMSIRSPTEGVILEQVILPGELALPGYPVVTVANLTVMNLTVYVAEDELNWVRLGETVEVRVDAYPDRGFTGGVVYIADQAEFTPRNVQTKEERTILVYAVKIRVDNPEEALKPGLPADAIFEVQP